VKALLAGMTLWGDDTMVFAAQGHERQDHKRDLFSRSKKNFTFEEW